MTKAQVKILFSTLLIAITSAITVNAADLPADVQNSPEIHVINTLLENGIVEVCPDGRFKPDHYITKADAARFTERVVAEKGAETDDENVVEESADEENTVEENIDEADDGFLTRRELACALYDYLKTLPSFDNSTYWYFDVSEDELAIGYVSAKGVMYPRPDGGFYPDAYVTRAEFCNALYAVSGLPLSYAPDNLPRKIVLDTPYVSQISPVYAVKGCEGASLLMGLKVKGYALNVGLREFLDNMPKHSSNPAKGYVGSPYKSGQYGLRTTIYPEILAEYGCNYGKTDNISSSSPRELQAEILSGNPVVVYATLRWAEPRYGMYDIEGESQRLLSNNHVVLVDGYDRDTNMYHISDPYNEYNTNAEYKYWIDGDTFERIYNERRHCVAVTGSTD